MNAAAPDFVPRFHSSTVSRSDRAALTNYLGTLSGVKMESLNRSLSVALALED